MPIPGVLFCPWLCTRSRPDVWLDYALHAVLLVARANFRARIKILLSCLNFRGRFRQQIPRALSLFCGFIMPGCALLLKRFKRKSVRRTKKYTRAHAALKSLEHSLCMQRICMSGTCPDCMRLGHPRVQNRLMKKVAHVSKTLEIEATDYIQYRKIGISINMKNCVPRICTVFKIASD